MDKAIRLINIMSRIGVTPNVITYTIIISGFVKTGEIEKAEKWFGEMSSKGVEPNLYSYNALMQGYTAGQKTDKVAHLMEEMNKKGVTPNEVTYNIIISGLVKMNQMEKAEKWLEEMVIKGVEPDGVYTIFIKRYAEDMNVDKIIELLTEMITKKVKLTVSAYCAIPPLFNNMQEKANDWFYEMRKKGVENDEAYKSLMYGYAQQMEKVLLLIEKTVHEKLDPYKNHSYTISTDSEEWQPSEYVYSAVVIAYEKAGKMEEAKRWAERKGIQLSVGAYRILIQGYLKIGQINEAMLQVRNMEIKKLDPNKEICNSMIGALVKQGYFEEANHWVDQMMSKRMQIFHSTLSLFREIREGLEGLKKIQG